MKTNKKTRSKRQRGGRVKLEIPTYLLNRINNNPHLIDLSDDLTEMERVRLITQQFDDLQGADNAFTDNHTIGERIDNLFSYITSQLHGNNWYKIAFYLVVLMYLMKPQHRPIGGRKTNKNKRKNKK
jgi:hypothetical protein